MRTRYSYLREIARRGPANDAAHIGHRFAPWQRKLTESPSATLNERAGLWYRSLRSRRVCCPGATPISAVPPWSMVPTAGPA
ncbi:MAG TPA: hypothetical protein VGG75_24700 [Trebonia sp.]